MFKLKKKYWILKKIGDDTYFAGGLIESTEVRGPSILDVYFRTNWRTTNIESFAYKFESKKEAQAVCKKLENQFILVKKSNL